MWAHMNYIGPKYTAERGLRWLQIYRSGNEDFLPVCHCTMPGCDTIWSTKLGCHREAPAETSPKVNWSRAHLKD